MLFKIRAVDVVVVHQGRPAVRCRQAVGAEAFISQTHCMSPINL